MREGVHRALAGAAIPSGYTILTWTSGAVLVQTHRLPRLGDALLFVAGMYVGFFLAGAVSRAGTGPGLDLDPRGVGACSLVSATTALMASGEVAHALAGEVAFAAVPAVATACFMLVEGAGLALLARLPTHAR